MFLLYWNRKNIFIYRFIEIINLSRLRKIPKTPKQSWRPRGGFSLCWEETWKPSKFNRHECSPLLISRNRNSSSEPPWFPPVTAGSTMARKSRYTKHYFWCVYTLVQVQSRKNVHNCVYIVWVYRREVESVNCVAAGGYFRVFAYRMLYDHKCGRNCKNTWMFYGPPVAWDSKVILYVY